jgi:DNA polymerase V
VRLAAYASETPSIISAAVRGLEAIWKDGFAYKKAGVVLLELIRPEAVPRDLFSPTTPVAPASLMKALDAVNSRFGKGAASFGLPAPDAPWRMRQERKTPNYTSRWSDIPLVG